MHPPPSPLVLWLALLLLTAAADTAPTDDPTGPAAARAAPAAASAAAAHLVRQQRRAAITKVHLVQSNHLDVGFTGSIVTVLNEYFDTYLPAAVNTSAALKRRGGAERLVFTTHAYVLSLFLDCPAGRGLHCVRTHIKPHNFPATCL